MSSKKRISVHGLEDFKDVSGKWVKSFIVTTPIEYIQNYTRAGGIWDNIQNRCRPNRACQERWKTYKGVLNSFSDFQEFAGWCQSQYGYFEREDNGRFWSLDKDLRTDKRVYSPESCMFIPNEVNTVFINCKKFNDLPLGVYFDSNSGKFKAQIRGTAKRNLGLFWSDVDAHKAWQQAKVVQIQNLLAKYNEHLLMQEALHLKLDILQRDIAQNAITNVL